LPTFHGSQTLEENQSAFGPGGSLPSDYSVSPQISMFAPVGGFTVGGSAGFSRVGSTSLSSTGGGAGGEIMSRGPDGGPTQTSGSSSNNFYSGSLVVAHRFGRNSLGLELASLKGTGSLSSTTTAASPGPYGRGGDSEQLATATNVTQTRLTLG